MNSLVVIESPSISEVEIVDPDAVRIGGLYAKSKLSIVESVRLAIECGERLADKKSEMGHGSWLPWLKANAAVLGFSTPRTAQKLMAAAGALKCEVESHLDADTAIAVSRKIWGKDHAHRTEFTGNDEWYTPAEYVDAARDVLGEFDLDPASCEFAQRTVRAKRYFDIDANGLEQDWSGTVWINPPYSQPLIAKFVSKLVSEYQAGHVTAAIMLTHNFSDTAWFHEAAKAASVICLTKGRIRFEHPEAELSQPTQGQCFHYFGHDADRFTDRFADIGLVMSLRRKRNLAIWPAPAIAA